MQEEDFPEEFRPIIRRLLKAGQEKEVYDVMVVEDEILDELAELERSLEDKDKTIVELRNKIKSLEG